MRRGRGGLLALAVWAAGLPAPAAGEVLTIGPVYDGGVVNLATGDQLVVRLPGEPASGQVWELAMHDPEVLKVETEPPLERQGAEPSQAFRFRAVAPGSSSIGIAYERPGDPASAPTRLFRVLAVVKDAAPRRSVTLEQPDDGSQIFLTQGERLVVKLPSSPTTGYNWTVAHNAASVLAPVGDPRFEPPEKPMPGASGFQIFEFRVVAGGASSLALVYRRGFEKDQPPTRRWAIFLSTAAVSAPPS